MASVHLLKYLLLSLHRESNNEGKYTPRDMQKNIFRKIGLSLGITISSKQLRRVRDISSAVIKDISLVYSSVTLARQQTPFRDCVFGASVFSPVSSLSVNIASLASIINRAEVLSTQYNIQCSSP